MPAARSSVVKFWIFDEIETPQCFPLGTLMDAVLEQFGSVAPELWLLRARGYGLTVNQWDNALDDKEKLLVGQTALAKLCAGEDEWFYDLDVLAVSTELEINFGLHDSTAMYVCAPEKISNAIARRFKVVRKSEETKGA